MRNTDHCPHAIKQHSTRGALRYTICEACLVVWFRTFPKTQEDAEEITLSLEELKLAWEKRQ